MVGTSEVDQEVQDMNLACLSTIVGTGECLFQQAGVCLLSSVVSGVVHIIWKTIIKWTAVKATCVFVNDVVYVSSYVLVACVCKFLLDCI